MVHHGLLGQNETAHGRITESLHGREERRRRKHTRDNRSPFNDSGRDLFIGGRGRDRHIVNTQQHTFLRNPVEFNLTISALVFLDCGLFLHRCFGRRSS